MVLFNLSKSDYEVHHGDRIAQLIVERIRNPPLVEVEVRNNLSYIVRFNFLKKKNYFNIFVLSKLKIISTSQV